MDELELVGERVALEIGNARLSLVEEVEVDDNVIHQVRADPREVLDDRYAMLREVVGWSHSRQ